MYIVHVLRAANQYDFGVFGKESGGKIHEYESIQNNMHYFFQNPLAAIQCYIKQKCSNV